MKILVINCGSSSLKYQLIDMETEEVIAKGLCERIGIDGHLVHKPEGKPVLDKNVAMPDHTVAVSLVLNALTDPVSGVIGSLSEISAVGHRIVHGGEKFSDAVILNDEVIADIEKCNDLAPLHNPANIIGIRSCQKLMPNAPMVGVFDTAFHQTMPEKAYLYALPYEYYEKYKIRRYGFHGTSHSFVSKRAAEFLNIPLKDSKIIVCHLGNGSSICAVDGGKSVDTSMGLTPLEGVAMGTRSGAIDPAIIEFIAEHEHMDLSQVMNVLNKKSGVYGVSGVSSDFRDLAAAAEAGDHRAQIALDVFEYQVAKYIGSYAVALGRVDAIVFTAGIGENNISAREHICNYLSILGVKLDAQKNNIRGQETILSADDSKVKVLLIPTNEELAIARQTKELVQG